MAAMKKSFCRNMIKLTSTEEKRYWKFPSQFFSGWDESQSVSYVPYVSGKCVAELNLSYFLTEAFDRGCCAEPLSWNYVLITLSRCKFHFENRIFRCFLPPSTSMPLWNSPQCFLFVFLCNLITSLFKVLCCLD